MNAETSAACAPSSTTTTPTTGGHTSSSSASGVGGAVFLGLFVLRPCSSRASSPAGSSAASRSTSRSAPCTSGLGLRFQDAFEFHHRSQKAKGASGAELVINKEFWTSLPGLIKACDRYMSLDAGSLSAGGLQVHVLEGARDRVPGLSSPVRTPPPPSFFMQKL